MVQSKYDKKELIPIIIVTTLTVIVANIILFYYFSDCTRDAGNRAGIGWSLYSSCQKDLDECAYEKYSMIKLEDFSYEAYNRCVIIITNGTGPIVPEDYGYTDKPFGIRKLDLEKNQLEGYNKDYSWNYWIICFTRW